MSDDDAKKYVIFSIAHRSYWWIDGRGYTDHILKAQRYTLENAKQITERKWEQKFEIRDITEFDAYHKAMEIREKGARIIWEAATEWEWSGSYDGCNKEHCLEKFDEIKRLVENG